jgi:hypothetical protein
MGTMPAPLDQGEREAAVRLLLELHRASVADVDTEHVWTLMGYVSAAARLGADAIEHHSGAERLHEHADTLIEHVAELEQK